MPTLDDYLALIPPEHAQQPRFVATLTALLQPLLDQQDVLLGMSAKFDLDIAQGAQLDIVGQWIGRSRFVILPVPSVYFSFDKPDLGFDEGRWSGRFDTSTTMSALSDADYRTLLRAKIASNNWDGTLSGAATAYAYVFDRGASRVFVQDNQDGSYSLNVAGAALSQIELALLTGGYIPLKPVGYRLADINLISVTSGALFGFDLFDAQVAGFDLGSWGTDIIKISVP